MIRGIKICGVSDEETLNFITNHAHPSKFIGFITNYKKSHRNVNLDILKKLTNLNKKKTYFVSVLVNPDDEILENIKDLNFDYYQLYDVTPERTNLIKKKYNKKIISAITIQEENDVEAYKLYQNIADILLFDGKGYEKSVGFNHEILNRVPNYITKMVAGSIKTDNIPNLKNSDFYIDLSSSLENEDGKKDLNKINYFLNNIKIYEA